MHPPEGDEQAVGREAQVRPRRWECHCSDPPFLLATYEDNEFNLKMRDRYYQVEGLHGRIRAICPLCGKWHTITLGSEQ
jgi:hypothetical protein